MVKDNSFAESLLEVAQGRGGQGGTERKKGRSSDGRLVSKGEVGMKTEESFAGPSEEFLRSPLVTVPLEVFSKHLPELWSQSRRWENLQEVTESRRTPAP